MGFGRGESRIHESRFRAVAMNGVDQRGADMQGRLRLKDPSQADAYRSPWPLRDRLKMAAFAVTWNLACRWTPGPLNAWRLLVLRCFGCRIEGRPYVARTCRIRTPWLLVLKHRSCLGPDSEVYNLDRCVLGERSTVAQQAYLCGGSHDFSQRSLPLLVGPIEVGADAFVGARAMVMPGVSIGEGAVAGAASVVTRDVAPWTVVAGSPARVIGTRRFRDEI